MTELIMSDMEAKLDPKQFGNRKKISIQHHLVRMQHRILTSLDKNSRQEINTALCLFDDW